MEPTTPTPDQGKSRLSGLGRKFFSLIEFDDEEELLIEIRKHPLGLTFIFIIGGFIAASVFSVVVALATSGVLEEVGFENGAPVIVFAGFILAIAVMVFTFISGQMYRNNVVFVTNEKIAQVQYITIFNRKISQLSIGDAQDVTVEQRSFFSRAFNYGTLVVETSGEQQNYTFSYVPEPYQASKAIVGAHEANLKLYGN